MERLKYVLEEDFDWSLDPRSLRDIFKRTNFDSIFVKLIAKDVIKILSPQLIAEPHNLVYDEDLVYEHLIGPLEKFICDLDVCASPDDVKLTLEHIQTLNQPSKLCRRILKAGDVIFSCNDCGLDNTCVVCIDCFHKSPHKDHNYRMANSDGGGCCDCGDVEAWKENYACTDHLALNQANLSLSDFEDKILRAKHIQDDKKSILDKIGRLPKGIASKYFLACQASLHCARMLLTWDNYHSLPQCLEIESNNDPKLTQLLSKESSSKNYFTVLFNDEVHTYDHVINTLVKIIKCTKMTASVMASTVSREGRSLIINDNYKSCKQVKDMIASVRDAGQGPLKVEVIHGTVLAHQAFALKLIEWIQKMSSLCDAFRILTAYTLLGTFNSIPEREEHSIGMTLIEKIMLSNTTYWKIARVEWNDLFVTTMLTEYSIKEQFARLITRIYPKLMQDFIQDDHEHSVSILTMTTQLYTVPSLICMLIEEENALSIISQTLIDTCKSTKRENPAISFENRNTFDMQGLRRGLYITSDLKHLINIQPTKWTNQLRNNVIEAVKIFLNLLGSMQGMDSVRRQLGQHLEYEPDWESGMTLQSRLITFITRLVIYCSFDEEVLVATLKETQARLLKNGGYKMITKELFGHQISTIQYDVATSPVSVHLPLTRFAAALIVELMRRRPSDKVPYDETLVMLTEQSEIGKHSMIDIMEPSLRTEVMIAQFRSGMWRRNGYSLVNQIIYFHGPVMRKEMFDRDILVLQECAAMCEANKFMIHILNKFQLFTWISSETTREPLVGTKAVSFSNDEEIMAQTMSLGEEFLQLLLTIINERYRVGVGIIEGEDVIKNEIIQLLCISPSTRSDLTQKLNVYDNELDCIKAVANLKRSTEASTGKYELKDEYYDRFNPFFYHYSRRHQSNALDAQLKRKKNLKETLICCPPPKPVELTKQFSNINELLRCDITLILIQKVLKRTLGPPENTQECSTKAPIRFVASDLQLDQSLHLIGLGLYEQERDPLSFGYLKAAHDKDIFLLLKECYDKAKRSKDLIFWLMKKTNELIETLSASYSISLDDDTTKVILSIRECLRTALSTCDTIKQDNIKRNSELAAQRRDRIMAMMKVNQDRFLSNPATKQLVADTDKNVSSNSINSNISIQPDMTAQAASSSQTNLPVYTTRSGRKTKPQKKKFELLTPYFLQQIELTKATKDPNAHVDYSLELDPEKDEELDGESIDMDEDSYETSHLCILCRDEQKIGFDQPTMVLLAYIQRSAVLSKNRGERRIPNYSLTPSNQLKHQILLQDTWPDSHSFTSDNSWSFDATFMPSDLFFGPHISTCGHVMHYDCWQGFFDAILKRETSRPNRNTRHVSFELEKNEILCPLCECISNATIPLIPNYTKFAQRREKHGRMNTIFSATPQVIEKSSENLSTFLHSLKGGIDVFKNIRHLREIGTNFVINYEGRYIRLLQPKDINVVLEVLDEIEALSLRDFINSVRSYKIVSSGCTKSLLSSISILAERIYSVGLDRDKGVTDVNHGRIFMMTSWTISYTIQAFERLTRFKGSPLFEDLESPKNLCLSSLLRFSCSSVLIHQSDIMQSLLVRKLRYLLINEEHLSSSPCCLDIDAFEMFVSLFILLQKFYGHLDDSTKIRSKMSSTNKPLSSSTESSETSESENYAWATRAFDHEYFRNVLHLMVILNMLQIIISMQNELTESQIENDSTSSNPNSNESSFDSSQSQQSISDNDRDCIVLHGFYKEIILASGHPNNKMPVINKELCTKVKNHLLPFLRSCAVFFYHLSHIQPPETLHKKSAFLDGKEFINPQTEITDEFINAQQSFKKPDFDLEATDEEFNAICQYLDLPNNYSILLQSQEARHLACVWLRHSRVIILIKSTIKERAVDLSKITESSSKVGPLEQAATSLFESVNLVSTPSSSTSTPPPPPTSQQISNTELMPVKFIHQPHLVNRLIDLPYDYSELVDKVSDFTCPSIKNEDSRIPTMCLICGVMLCSQSYCCQRDLNDLASNYQQILQGQQDNANATVTEAQLYQRRTNRITNLGYAEGASIVPANIVEVLSFMGSHSTGLLFSNPNNMSTTAAPMPVMNSPNLVIHQQLVGSCTYHAYECSAGIGMFLRIRTSQILLLSGRSKGCYMPAPYVDDHGETDFGLARGNPLHLNRQHYEKLQQMWLTHAIPEQISRRLEYSPYASSVNWHLH